MKKNFLSAVILLMSLNISAVTVTFVDWDGSVLAESDVLSGEGAYEPEHPTREGFLFTGWSKGFCPVYTKTTTTAQYTPIDALGTDVEINWHLSEHTNAVVTGPVEPFSETRSGLEDGSYICTQSTVSYPTGCPYGADHNFHMLQMKWTEGGTETYNPDIYVEFAFRAAAIIDLDAISMFVGSSGWNWMRFTVMYSTDDYFEEPVLLYETDSDIDKATLTEINESVNFTVQEGDNFYIRVYPWMHKLSDVFASSVYTFFPIVSEVKITGEVHTNDNPGDTPGDNPTDIRTAGASGKVVKHIEDGQLIIEKNGVRYNAIGNVIK